MKTFKTYLEENRLAAFTAATALAGSALAAPPKQEALDILIDYTKQREKFRPVAEPDTVATGKPPVVGYGTTHVYPDTKQPIKIGDKVTQERAEELMKSYFTNMTPKLEKIPGWDDMTPGQQAAIMSFGYNAGGGFYGAKGYETITQALKDKNYEAVPDAMRLYVMAGGKKLRGLVNRREEEIAMWNTKSPEKTQPKPQPTAQPTQPKPQPTAQPTQPKPQPAAQPSQHYEVKGGDVLGGIAKQHGKSVEDLMKLNPDIKDPNKIRVGQKIRTK